MRILKWLLGIVVVLGLAFLIGGYLLPREVSVSRSVIIDAPAEEVFPHVNSLQAASDWSPWLGRDPETKLTFSGPEEGVGNRLDWASEHPQVGSGFQVITLSEPNERVSTDLDFGTMGTARADFRLAESGGSTAVTWTLDADMGSGPMGRWMGLMMDRWVGADYEAGLQNLKARVEG